MNNIIRWPGLVAFAVLSGLITLFTWLFLDNIIKSIATDALEEATGAEVNIGEVQSSFSPFGIVFSDVQLTDPEKPEYNQLQAERIQANIQPSPLFIRKVIVDELEVTGAEVFAKREKPGKVYREPESQDSGFPSFGAGEAIPEVDDLLANSPLKTTQAIKDVNEAYAQHSESLQRQYEALPDKTRIDDYQARLKALSDRELKDPEQIAEAKQEFDQIMAELNADKEKLSSFKDSLEDAKSDVSPKLTALKNAPQQDYDLLSGAIAGDAGAINEVTKMIFGEKADQWSHYVLGASKIIAPMLDGSAKQQQQNSRAQGRWIAFDDASGLPDIWIKKANISLNWQGESVQSEWTDITHQHDILGRPTRYTAIAGAGALWQSLDLDGQFEFTHGAINGLQNWLVKGVKLSEQELVNSSALTSTLAKGLLSSNGKLAINDSALNGNGKIDLSDMRLNAEGQSNLTQVIAETLTGLSALSIDTQLSGTVEQPQMDFSSDLDSKLASAMLSNLSGDQQSKLNELKQKLDAQASDALGTDSQMSQWIEWESLADGSLGSVDDMLKSQFDSALDKEKDKIKDKLLNKLFKN